MTLDDLKPPVWLVRGVDWTCEITSDAEDLDLPYDEQAMEAATKALEIFKGVVPLSDKFILDDKIEEPHCGIVLEVFLKNHKEEHNYMVYSYIALANGGFYEDANYAFEALVEEYYEEAKKSEDLNRKLMEILSKGKPVKDKLAKVKKPKKAKKKPNIPPPEESK